MGIMNWITGSFYQGMLGHVESGARRMRKKIGRGVLIFLFVVATVIAVYLGITKVLIPATYSVKTECYYSAGNERDYSAQRQEFDVNMDCYVKVSSAIDANKFWGKNKEITVKYVFTGVDICDVIIAKDVLMQVELNVDANQITYSCKQKAVYGEEETERSPVVFLYLPRREGVVSLKIEYDDNVDEKYDCVYTVDFVNN